MQQVTSLSMPWIMGTLSNTMSKLHGRKACRWPSCRVTWRNVCISTGFEMLPWSPQVIRGHGCAPMVNSQRELQRRYSFHFEPNQHDARITLNNAMVRFASTNTTVAEIESEISLEYTLIFATHTHVLMVMLVNSHRLQTVCNDDRYRW